MSPFPHPYLEKFLKGGGGEPVESYAIAQEGFKSIHSNKSYVIALERLQMHPFQGELCYHTSEASDSSLLKRIVLSH